MLVATAAERRRAANMGPFIAVLVLAVASGAVDATVAVVERTSATQWGRVAAEFFNMNVVCGQCDDLCPKSPYVTPEESRKAAALHWACYIGCRTTCLLQMGPDNFEYDTSKKLCIKGCHDEYKSSPENDNIFSRACVEACSGKVVSPKITSADLSRAYAQLDLEETETILFDPSIDINKNDGLSHSSFKTLPRKDSLGMYTNIKRRLAGKTSLEHVLNFFKDPSTDPVLAGAIAIPLFLALFCLSCYLLYVVSLAKRARKIRAIRLRREAREAQDAQQARNVLRVQIESDDKKVPLLSSDLSEDDFVPPPSPPPKYSDIVQTV
ncbi:Testis anion transporter 1 [Frankliniella fusca]|uniref:Testis anion transporter 1 n=1 Tax=Frankliniella fusca TaxID=407009 RepID=A0AAE1GZ45_9NEOP|nr:Testis anion transporter 1 [Frankliniella fusca]